MAIETFRTRHGTHLHRRALLRGALLGGGMAVIPLPRLGAMLNGNGTAYAASNRPLRRFGVWFVGNGFIPTSFVPTPRKTGPLGTLSPILAPLEKVKSRVTVVSGFDLKTGTLLDNSTVMISSCVSWGKTHTQWEWPCVIGGRGGVRMGADGQPDPGGRLNFRGGWHHRSHSHDNFSKVLLTLANLNEANRTSFGKDGGLATSEVPDIRGPLV